MVVMHKKSISNSPRQRTPPALCFEVSQRKRTSLCFWRDPHLCLLLFAAERPIPAGLPRPARVDFQATSYQHQLTCHGVISAHSPPCVTNVRIPKTKGLAGLRNIPETFCTEVASEVLFEMRSVTLPPSGPVISRLHVSMHGSQKEWH